jgi:pimeloyl-ACP methyl ester carboxylesterase
MSTTVFSLVHGGQQGAWCFEPLIDELARHGHRSVAIDLPIEDPDAGSSEYADAVVDSLRDVDDEVVVVGHSLGGLTLPLIAQHRPVRLLVFLCAAVPVPGSSLYDVIEADARGGSSPSLLDDTAERHLTAREEARELFFPDCPPEVQEWALDRQRAQCERPHREVTPLREWPSTPAIVVHGRLDRCIPIERGRRIALRVFGQPPVVIEEGHVPFLTNVPLVADRLDRLASAEDSAWPIVHALSAQPAPLGTPDA